MDRGSRIEDRGSRIEGSKDRRIEGSGIGDRGSGIGDRGSLRIGFGAGGESTESAVDRRVANGEENGVSEGTRTPDPQDHNLVL